MYIQLMFAFDIVLEIHAQFKNIGLQNLMVRMPCTITYKVSHATLKSCIQRTKTLVLVWTIFHAS